MRVNTGRLVDYDSVLEKGTLYRKERNTQKYAEPRNGSGDERGLKAGTKVFGLSGWGDGSPFMDRGRNWLRV